MKRTDLMIEKYFDEIEKILSKKIKNYYDGFGVQLYHNEKKKTFGISIYDDDINSEDLYYREYTSYKDLTVEQVIEKIKYSILSYDFGPRIIELACDGKIHVIDASLKAIACKKFAEELSVKDFEGMVL